MGFATISSLSEFCPSGKQDPVCDIQGLILYPNSCDAVEKDEPTSIDDAIRVRDDTACVVRNIFHSFTVSGLTVSVGQWIGWSPDFSVALG